MFSLDQSPNNQADTNEAGNTGGDPPLPNPSSPADASPPGPSVSTIMHEVADAIISELDDTVVQSDAPATKGSPSPAAPTSPVPTAPALVGVARPAPDAGIQPSPIASTTAEKNDNMITNDEDTTTVAATPTIENAPSQEPATVRSQLATEDSLLVEAPSLLATRARKTAGIRTTDKSCPDRNTSSTPSCGDSARLCLPANIQEPIWMKKKGTLVYFKSAFKTEGLSNLISNWYQLEAALGFPEQVCFSRPHLSDNILTIWQTPKGFPVKSRPTVVGVFIKYGHNYRRSYGLEARSFGQEVSTWWGEISATAHAGYGGTTGIYTLIVLMTWWCGLLRKQSDSERAEYVAIVEDLNRAVLDALRSTDKTPGVCSPTTNSLPIASPVSPQPNNRHAKRASSIDLSSRKRLRT